MPRSRRLRHMQAVGLVTIDALGGIADLVAPGTGIPIRSAGQLISHMLAEHIEDQILETLEEIKQRLATLEEQGRLDQQRLRSREWQQRASRGLAAVAVDDPEKRGIYASAVAAMAATDRPSELDDSALLTLVQSLSASELVYSKMVVDDWRSDQFAVAGGIIPRSWGPDREFYVNRLQGLGLLSPILDATGQPPGRVQGTRYMVTDTMRRMIHALEVGGFDGRSGNDG